MPTAEAINDAKWAAESDARTLADADVILGDKKRIAAAKKAAKRMVDEEIKDAQRVADRLNSLLKIANKTGTVEGMKIVNERD